MRGNRPRCCRPTSTIASGAWRRCSTPPRSTTASAQGVIASRIGLQTGGNLYDARHRHPRRGRGGAEEAQAPLHPARRGAVPDPRPGRPARLDLRRARHPGARLRPAGPISRPICSRAAPHLLALADTLVELKAVCECGRKATMNLRVDADGRAVQRRARRSRSAATTATSRSAAAISWSGSPRSRASSCGFALAREAAAATLNRRNRSPYPVEVRGGISWSARFSPLSRSSPPAASRCRPRRPQPLPDARDPRLSSATTSDDELTG